MSDQPTRPPFQLPILVNGRPVHADPADCHRIEYETGAVVLIPRLTPELVAEITAAPRSALDHLDLDDIAILLDRVSSVWSDPAFPGRAEAVRMGAAVTGFSPRMMDEDHARMAAATTRAKLYDIVDADLGDALVLDHWMPSHSVLLKARPAGRVLHVMVGNVPLAGLFTLVRSMLTKNTTVAKLPSRDPVTCLLYALAFHAVAPDHPVTRSLSVVFWPGGDPVEDEFVAAADVVCAWGGEESIDALKRKVPRNTGFLEFGPKESLMLIGGPVEDLSNLAMRAAFDISAYEQEACFSPQRVFVEGDPAPFVDELCAWLDKLLVRLPVGHRPLDQVAHLTRSRQSARFDGCDVRSAAGGEWTVVTVPDGDLDRRDHPLGRTVFVHRVEDLRDVVPLIHPEVQTIGVHPWTRGLDLADELTVTGASRITEVGLMTRHRVGFTHDGRQPLRSMVRWVSVERGLDHKGRHQGRDRAAFEERLYVTGPVPGAPGPTAGTPA
jgi:long-chain-fatty-acyl-CoA reductase